MRTEVFIPWDEWTQVPLHGCTRGCTCCLGVGIMPTEEELEQRITEQIDSERFSEAISNSAGKGTVTINGVEIKGKDGDSD